MNIALSDTILYVTGKQGIENTTQQELQTMVAEYPYFAPAQLIFAAKLKSENSFKLQTQIQKTGLFFNNFKWLQYQDFRWRQCFDQHPKSIPQTFEQLQARDFLLGQRYQSLF